MSNSAAGPQGPSDPGEEPEQPISGSSSGRDRAIGRAKDAASRFSQAASSAGQAARDSLTRENWERGKQAATSASEAALRHARTAGEAAGRFSRSAASHGRTAFDQGRSMATQGQAAARTGAAPAAAYTTAHASAAWQTSQQAYQRATKLSVDATGRFKRPWEVTSAAVLGLIAPLFLIALILTMVQSGGRNLRLFGGLLERLGQETGVDGFAVASGVAATIAHVLLGIGIAISVLIIASFGFYAWRLLVGRGKTRWLALVALVFTLLTLTLFAPLLATCFLVVGTASVVLAFLPRASAWFAFNRRLRGGAAAAGTAPAPTMPGAPNMSAQQYGQQYDPQYGQPPAQGPYPPQGPQPGQGEYPPRF